MRISLVTETFPPEVNGVARTLQRLVDGLCRRGHEVDVIRPRRSDIDGSENGFRHIQVPGAPLPGYGRLRFGFFCRRRLLRLWSERPPSAIHIATEGPLGLSALSAGRKLGLPVGTSFHTNFHTYGKFYGYGWITGLALAYLRWMHNRADYTLVPATDTLETLHDAGFERLGVLSRGVDAELFSPSRRDEALRASWGAVPEAPIVIYVGRLAPEKNIDLVFEGFEAIRARHPAARLVLVGDGPREHQLARTFPEARFCGVRHGIDLATHYASGDIFLFPSQTETFGNVVLEAMASGLAVVGYDYAAAAQHIDGSNGLVAPFGDREQFIERALEMAASPARWLEAGRAARTTAEGASWSRIVDDFEERLRRLANGSPS